MNRNNKRNLIRYLRSHGLQQKDIARIIGDKNHQNVGYHLRNLRSEFFNKEELLDSNGGGVVSLLVGYASDPPPLSNIEQDHTCPHYCQLAAYVQMEDLPKHQKIAVLLSLLQEVEAE